MSEYKKILVLGGGFDQIELINELALRGSTIFLADYLEEPVAARYAKKHFRVSTLDTQAITKLARDLKIDLIATACTDQALLSASIVSSELGLPFYLAPETALKLTNKLHMKKVFINNKIPTAAYYELTTEQQENMLPPLRYPVVVKPADCNSSKGILKVYDPSNLHCAISAAIQQSRTKTALLEEFIAGTELSIDVYITGDKAHVISVTETIKSGSEQTFTIIQSKYPANISSIAHANIELQAQKIAEAFQLTNCPLLIQAISAGDDIYVIETSARLGGGTKYKLIETVSEFCAMRANVQTLLGETPLVKTTNPKIHARMNYCYCHNGQVGSLDSFEALKQSGVIDDYFVYKQPGSVVSNAVASGDRVAGYLLCAQSEQELQQKQSIALKDLQVLTPEGDNILKVYDYN